MTADNIGIIMYIIFVFIVVPSAIMDELPRGLRWLKPLAIKMIRGIKFVLLRVFYPERLNIEIEAERKVMQHRNC